MNKKTLHQTGKWTAAALLLLCFLAFLLPALSKSAFAAGMNAEVSVREVETGDEIPVTVSFSGTEIWYAFVRISFEDPILSGGGSYLIEPEMGESSVSETWNVKALIPGTTTILIEGYTDEDESTVYQAAIPVTITGEVNIQEPVAGGGRAAAVDENYRDANGQYINRKKPELINDGSEDQSNSNTEAPGAENSNGNPDIDNANKADSESTKKEQADTETGETENIDNSDNNKEKTGAADSEGQNQTEKNRAADSVLILVIAGLLLAAAVALTIVLILKRKKIQRPKTEEKTEDEDKNE